MKSFKIRSSVLIIVLALTATAFGACKPKDGETEKNSGESGGKASSEVTSAEASSVIDDSGVSPVSGIPASSKNSGSSRSSSIGGPVVIDDIDTLPNTWKPKTEAHTKYNTALTALDPYMALTVDENPFDYKNAGYNAQRLGDSYLVGSDGVFRNQDAALRGSNGNLVNYSGDIGTNFKQATTLPTKGYTDFHIAEMLKAIDAGVVRAHITEVGVFGFSGYEKAFRDEWQAAYGTAWPSTLWTDPNYYFMAQDLRSKMVTTQLKRSFEAVKAKKSNLSTMFGTHAPIGYYSFGVAVGSSDIAGLSVVDQIEGQTWSNTIRQPFTYNGVSAERPFVNGFFDYGYYAELGRANGKRVLAITDPKGDHSTAWTLEYCNRLYRDQIVAMMAYPNVYRYNVCEWPERGYSGTQPMSTAAWKTICNNVIAMQNQMYKYQNAITTANASVKVGVLVMDTACYQARGPEGGAGMNDMFGLFSGLMMNGLMAKPITLGRNAPKNDLFKEYDVIIASYDTMKPLNKLANEKLESFVKNGGTVLFFGGKGAYEDISFGWWKQAGFASPQDELFSRFGIGATGRVKNQSGALTPASGSVFSGAGTISTGSYKAVTYDNVSGATPAYTLNGKVAGFEKASGKGHFVFVGVDPAVFCNSGMGDVQFNLAKTAASKYHGKQIAKQDSFSYRRGPWYGFSSIEKDAVTETGKFIDIFDENLAVIDKKTVKKGESAFLLNVSDKLKSTYPVVLFAPGTNPTIVEYKNITRVVTNGPQDSIGTIRIYVPEGYTVKSVTAKDNLKKDRLISKAYDPKTKTLLVTYKNNFLNLIVDVEYK